MPIKYLAFDTETTCFHQREAFEPFRLLELGWACYAENGTLLSSHNYIIKVNVPISDEASEYHGITKQRAEEEGKPLAEVMTLFMSDVDQADTLIAHNMEFDMKVVMKELNRDDYFEILKSKKKVDTMRDRKFLKSNGKWYKLNDLYRECFGHPFSNAHNSLADAQASAEIYFYKQH